MRERAHLEGTALASHKRRYDKIDRHDLLYLNTQYSRVVQRVFQTEDEIE